VKPVKCSRGHYYDAELDRECPVCAAEKEAMDNLMKELDRREKSVIPHEKSRYAYFAETEDPEHTLIFVVYDRVAFRLYTDRDGMMLQLRYLRKGRPDLILERVCPIPADQADKCAREILEILSEHQVHAIFRGKQQNPQGDRRILFRSRQLSFDYRWDSTHPWTHAGERKCMQKLLIVLYRAIADLESTGRLEKLKRYASNFEAELEDHNLGYTLFWEVDGHGIEYRLIMWMRIYYEWVNFVCVEKVVTISREDAKSLIRKLSESEIIETLLRKNKRPSGGLYVDPGITTRFFLHDRDVTFSYSDWNKENTMEEASVVGRAMDHFYGYILQDHWRNKIKNKDRSHNE